MAEELKIVIDADVNGAIAGVKKFENSVKGLTTGSIAQLQKAALLLRTQLSNLSPSALKSDFGKELTSSLKIVNKELKTLQTESGVAGNAVSGAFGKAFSGARQLANIIPGLGISGLLLGVGTAIAAIANSFTSASSAAKLYADAQDDAIGKSGAEIFKINAAVAVLKDHTSSLNAQTNARAFLNKETGISIGLLSQEKINSEETAIAINKATEAIFQKALAEAFAAKSAQKQVELFEKQQKLAKIQASLPTTALGIALNANNLASAGIAIELITREITQLKKEIEDIGNLGQGAFKKAFDVPPPPTKPIKVKVEVKDFVLPEGLRPIKVPIEFDFTNFFSTQIPKDLFKDVFPKGGKQTKLIDGLVPGASEDVVKRNKQFFDDFQAQLKATASLVTDVLAPAFTDMFDAITQGKNPLKAFFDGLLQSVNQLIKKLIAAAIEAAILSAISGGSAGGFGSIFKGLLGLAKGGQANFGLGGAIGGRSFQNTLNVVVTGSISGSTINLAGQRAANSTQRGG